MRPVSFRLQLSAVTWIAIVLMLGLSSGCQQWSLRKNMSGFFGGGEPTDDWEAPVPSARQEEDPEKTSANDKKNRPWWNRRKPNEVPRVVLPRDRSSAASRSKPDSTNNFPKLPVAAVVPQTRPNAPANMPGPSPTLSTTNPETVKNSPEPKGELVAFGANPSGLSGAIVAPAREEAKGVSPHPSIVDTGVRDTDLEASLQSLPPEFREVVRRTLQSVKDGKPIDAIEPAPTATASTGPISVRLSEGTMTSLPTPAASNPVPAIGLPAHNLAANPANTSVPSAASTPAPGATAPMTGTVAAIPTAGPPSFLPPAANQNPVSVPGLASTGLVAPSFVAPATNQAVPPANISLAVADAKSPGNVVTTSANVATSSADPLQASNRPTTWRGVINEAIEKLEHDLESTPTADESLRRSQEITLRMLYVSQRRLDDALRPIELLDGNEQEYVRHQMQALYEASNPDANPSRPRHWSTVMMSQREATSHLAAVSNLEVRSLAFCTQVDGYGMYQKFPKNQFMPGQEVLLYCEIDNVAAEKVKAGFETHLHGSYEIRDVSGRVVADQELTMEPEICMNHRRDYFLLYIIYMPSQIPSGNYELRLTIQDKKGGKYGHSNTPFEIRK